MQIWLRVTLVAVILLSVPGKAQDGYDYYSAGNYGTYPYGWRDGHYSAPPRIGPGPQVGHISIPSQYGRGQRILPHPFQMPPYGLVQLPDGSFVNPATGEQFRYGPANQTTMNDPSASGAFMPYFPHGQFPEDDPEKLKECTEDAHEQYDKDCERCRKIKDPEERAKCWKKAAEDLANRISDCNRRFGPGTKQRPVEVKIYSRDTDPPWIHYHHARSPYTPDYGKRLYYYPNESPDQVHQLYSSPE